MTSFIAKWVTKRILGERLENKFGQEDPYFEQVPATRLDGTPSGKFKKQRKALPPGLSEHDGRILTKVKRRAYRLDSSLCNCCGVRFGWSSIIGIIPAIGDVIDALLALMVVKTCDQVEGGLPAAVKSRMYFNVIVDFGIGIIPFIGDVADAVFRANTRNAIVLEEFLREKGKKTLRQSGMPVPTVDPSDPHDFDRLHRDESPPRYTSEEPQAQGVMTARPQRNNGSGSGAGATTTTNTPAAARPAKSSLFSFGSRSRPRDVEMGADSAAVPSAATSAPRKQTSQTGRV